MIGSEVGKHKRWVWQSSNNACYLEPAARNVYHFILYSVAFILFLFKLIIFFIGFVYEFIYKTLVKVWISNHVGSRNGLHNTFYIDSHVENCFSFLTFQFTNSLQEWIEFENRGATVVYLDIQFHRSFPPLCSATQSQYLFFPLIWEEGTRRIKHMSGLSEMVWKGCGIQKPWKNRPPSRYQAACALLCSLQPRASHFALHCAHGILGAWPARHFKQCLQVLPQKIIRVHGLHCSIDTLRSMVYQRAHHSIAKGLTVVHPNISLTSRYPGREVK